MGATRPYLCHCVGLSPLHPTYFNILLKTGNKRGPVCKLQSYRIQHTGFSGYDAANMLAKASRPTVVQRRRTVLQR